MPEQDGGIVRFDYNDPDDMAVLIATGLIWKGPVAGRRLAVEALIDKQYPMEDSIPPDARTYIEEEQARRFQPAPDGTPTLPEEPTAPPAAGEPMDPALVMEGEGAPPVD